MTRRRALSEELLRRGLVANESESLALFADDRVVVNGAPARSGDRLVAPGDDIRVLPVRRFVSRGGDKLDAALDDFGLDVGGTSVVDVGASTGGFTDCVLQRGAARVVAADVGRGLLHERIAADPRVVVREGTDARALVEDSAIRESADLVLADLSFISLRLVVDALIALVRPGGHLLCLVKPQFEATSQEASRGGGVITDDDVRRRVVARVVDDLAARGLVVIATHDSRVTGRSGNREVFVLARRPEG